MAPIHSVQIRNDFPALQRVINGRPIAYFDAPGGTQVPQTVIDAVADYLAHHNANTQGAFATSAETDAMIWSARERLASFLNANSPREIAFGANMTTVTFAFSRALAETWERGDEIVVTELDHQANIAPWRRVAAERGLTVRSIPFDLETLTLDYDALEASLSGRTRLVAIGYASNAVGTINDVARVAELARAAGALSYVDAVHFAPHRSLDVQQIGCDLLVCSAYKFFGPHIGVLWGKEEHLARFRPIKVPPAADTVPERWETGTLNHEGIAGAAAAVEWISGLASSTRGGHDFRERIRCAMQAVEQYESGLFRRLYSGLMEIPAVRVFGVTCDAPRTPTAAFTIVGMSPREVEERLGAQGLFVWSGDFYASTVVERLGLASSGGLVRAGLAVYNTDDEVERLLEAIAALAR